MSITPRTLFFVLPVLFGLPTQVAAQVSPRLALHEKIERVLRIEANPNVWTSGHYSLVSRMYEALLSPAQQEEKISRLPDGDLEDLFEATESASSAAIFGGQSHDYVGDLTLDLRVLERRRLASDGDYVAYYRVLVLSGRFDSARRFYSEHPDLGLSRLPKLPTQPARRPHDKIGVMVLAPGSHGQTVTLHQVNLQAPAQVIILADPECHFSEYFLSTIDRHPNLWAALRSHAVWVTPPDGILEADRLWSWNRTHAHDALSIIYNLRQWPMITRIALPTFYFLYHGKVLATLKGWPREGNFPELRADLERIGLLPETERPPQ